MKSIGMATLGRDAEMRYTPSGDAVANLSLAVNYYSKDAENNRATQWIDATLWGKQAEALVQYMTKGSRHCFTLSDIHMEEYDGKDGYVKTKLVARVDSVELGAKKEGGDSGSGAAGQRRPAAGGPRPTAPAPAPTRSVDDDIPF